MDRLAIGSANLPQLAFDLVTHATFLEDISLTSTVKYWTKTTSIKDKNDNNKLKKKKQLFLIRWTV